MIVTSSFGDMKMLEAGYLESPQQMAAIWLLALTLWIPCICLLPRFKTPPLGPHYQLPFSEKIHLCLRVVQRKISICTDCRPFFKKKKNNFHSYLSLGARTRVMESCSGLPWLTPLSYLEWKKDLNSLSVRHHGTFLAKNLQLLLQIK